MNLPWHHTFLSLHLSAAFTIRLPSDSTSRWTPLSLAVSFPLLGRIRDFHPLETCAARRTIIMTTSSAGGSDCRQSGARTVVLAPFFSVCSNCSPKMIKKSILSSLSYRFFEASLLVFLDSCRQR